MASVLIVEPARAEAWFLMTVLSSVGFEVTVAEHFKEAKTRLEARPPGVLMTEIRLGAYNGLHLVLRAKSLRPDVAAIVTSHLADRALQIDTEQLGATYMMKPVTREELLAAVSRTLARKPGELESPIRPPFERRKSKRRVSPGTPFRPERRRGERRQDLVSLIRQLA